MKKKHWFITGVSSGFGREIAKAALQRGDVVVGTLRQESQIADFESMARGRAHALVLDVTDAESIAPVVEEAIKRAEVIDVLVNNAGYGLYGAIEEISDREARHVMETNFFGALSITRSLLPHLRTRGWGHIVNISSIAGLIGRPGAGLYNASKFALEGFSEALSAEVAPFGIRVTIVEPGGFRTEFAGSSVRYAAQHAAYTNTPAAISRTRIMNRHGQQSGDPGKAARVILNVVDAESPPLRLPLGEDALAVLRSKASALAADLGVWEELALDTSVDVG